MGALGVKDRHLCGNQHAPTLPHAIASPRGTDSSHRRESALLSPPAHQLSRVPGGKAMALPTGIITYLFTDIEGSTRMVQRLGTEFDEVLADHNISVAMPRTDPEEAARVGGAVQATVSRPSRSRPPVG